MLIICTPAGLEDCYFVGPRPQPVLAQINSVSDVGLFPSLNEPFGMVFIEVDITFLRLVIGYWFWGNLTRQLTASQCMACGTPVIGCNSGGPRDFVSEEVGKLVEEDSV